MSFACRPLLRDECVVPRGEGTNARRGRQSGRNHGGGNIVTANRSWRFRRCCFLLLASAATGEECLSCVRVNAACYNVSQLLELDANFRNKIVINKIAVLHADNTLFFGYEPEIADPEYFKIGYVNLDEPSKTGVIVDKNISGSNFGTFDIDQQKSTLYLGGKGGVFTYDESKKLHWFSSLGDDILVVFFKTNLYLVKANDSTIIVKKGNAFESVLEYAPVKNFVVNRDNVIVFLSTYGLFLNKKEETVWLSKNAYFRGLTIDLDGAVYAWWVDGIYLVDVKRNLTESRVVRVAELDNIGAMTFDNENNILFTSGKALNRMTISNVTDC
ncbi:hypothetical protein ACJJTC_010897 [Scirpophaga incertulas]